MRTCLTPRLLRIFVLWFLVLPGALSSQMPQPLGRLNITSNPEGADISIDGKSGWTTPVTLVVAPISYVVQVTGPGPVTCKLSCTVKPGETVQAKCPLPPANSRSPSCQPVQ